MDENLKSGYKFSLSATIYGRFMLCKLDLTRNNITEAGKQQANNLLNNSQSNCLLII